MAIRHTQEVYKAIFGQIYDTSGFGGFHGFSFDDKPEYREETDKWDSRNLLLNILDSAYRAIRLLVIAPLGVQITRGYASTNGLARVVYTVTFNFKDSKTNLLVDDPTLDALSTYIEPEP